MGERAFPPSRKKRELLNGPATPPERLSALGGAAEAEGFLNDALDFFEKAGDGEGLARLRARAVEEGDLFLLGRASKALVRAASREELAVLARRAEELGKIAFAVEAYRRAGDEAQALRLSAPSAPALDNPQGHA